MPAWMTTMRATPFALLSQRAELVDQRHDVRHPLAQILVVRHPALLSFTSGQLRQAQHAHRGVTPMTKKATEHGGYLLLGLVAAVMWAIAGWVGLRMLMKYNDGDMTHDDALLTTVAVATLAFAVSMVFVCVTLWLTLWRLGHSAEPVEGGGDN